MITCVVFLIPYIFDIYIYEQNVKEGGRVFPQVKQEKFKPLPIIIPTLEERKSVENLVIQIIELKSKFENTEKLEHQLNIVIDKLYNRQYKEGLSKISTPSLSQQMGTIKRYKSTGWHYHRNISREMDYLPDKLGTHFTTIDH